MSVDVTIVDVARHARVTKGTVSRALNGYPDIAPATRDRVLAAAEALGYFASVGARRLKRRRTDTIAVVLPRERGYVADPFLTAFLDGASRRLEAAGLDLLMIAALGAEDQTERYRRLIAARKVDGFLVTRTDTHDQRIAVLREAGVPFVAHGRTQTGNAHAWLDTDNAGAMREAVAYLSGLGHRRIGYVGGPRCLNFAYERRLGFRDGVAAHDLATDDDLLVDEAVNAQDGAEATRRLLARPRPPTAIVAARDDLAIGALQALRDAGLRAGLDVSVMGYDDVPLAAYTDPPLTTFAHASTEAGAVAADMLVRLIEGEPALSLQQLWTPTMIRRASTGVPMRSRPHQLDPASFSETNPGRTLDA